MPYAEDRIDPRRRRARHGDARLARALRRPRNRGRARARLRSARCKPGEETLIDALRAPRTRPGGSRASRGRDHAAQELERDRLVPRRRTGRARSTCSASRASSSSTRSSTEHSRRRARRRPRLRLRHRARPQPRHRRFLRRSTAACCRSATCRSPTSRAPARWPAEAIAMGCKALLVASACPRGHSPSHVGLDPGLGDRAGGRRCRSSSTSAAAARCSTRTTSRTGCRRCPTSTAAPRTSARSTTWRSRTRRCRRSRR